MTRAVFPPPIPGDSRWQIPYGGLALSVAVAAWRRGQWLIARGTAAIGRGRPELPRVTLSFGEPPPHAVRRLLRALGLRSGAPKLLEVRSRKARRGYWDVTFVYAAPVTGRTKAARDAVEPDFRPGADPDVAIAFRASGIERGAVERRLGIERRRGRKAASPPAALNLRETRDRDFLRAFLLPDAIGNCYALGDLDPPYFAAARFFAAGTSADCRALIAHYPFDEHPTAIAVGAPEGIAALLRGPYRPPLARFQLREEHEAAVRELYEFAELEGMLRMGLTRESFRPRSNGAEVAALNEGDADEVCRLHRLGTGPFNGADAVRRSLQCGAYFGIREGGRLVAVGGTHAFGPSSRTAVIGGFFTDPERRGRGHAATIGSVLVTHLLAGADAVGLNVKEGNAPAAAAYQAIGFTVRHRFLEGSGIRRE